MYIVVGLGNPSKEYQDTRHNTGFAVIDKLAEAYSINVSVKKHKAQVGKGRIDGVDVILAKPQTYMNLSGESVRALTDYYQIDPKSGLIVIYDDISLDVGQLRIRGKGSDGGHNGIKNIITHLGGNAFLRIRVGVGDKPKGWELADYVLSRFTGAERKEMEESVKRAADAVRMLLSGRLEEAMNVYNTKVLRP